MVIKPEEIMTVIQDEIAGFRDDIKLSETGTVLQVGDGIARCFGLSKVMAGEMVEFPDGIRGYVLNLEEENVGIILLGPDDGIREGHLVKRTGKVLRVPVGEAVVGRVVNALGEAIDGHGSIIGDQLGPVETPARGVIERQPVQEPLQTGLIAVDSMIPIGRGQRELIIGDRQTGKTSLAIDTIINQRDSDVICIYVAIGQKVSTVAQIVETLRRHDAMRYTAVVVAAASEPAPLQFIAPYAGCAMGEWFRDRGRHVLVVYDDLTKHAQAYRQISLLLRRPPGREAYPADIFYLHARLLERAARLDDRLGGGSLTALPIIETQAGDVSAYIPTNVISITDGQIYLESSLFHAGVRPAINVGLSVSRVGGSAQVKGMKQVAGRLRIDLAQYRELAAFAQFSKDLDKASQSQLARGERLVEILKQSLHQPMPVADQVLLIWAATRGYVDQLAPGEVGAFKQRLRQYAHRRHPELLLQLTDPGGLTDAVHEQLTRVVREFIDHGDELPDEPTGDVTGAADPGATATDLTTQPRPAPPRPTDDPDRLDGRAGD